VNGLRQLRMPQEVARARGRSVEEIAPKRMLEATGTETV